MRRETATVAATIFLMTTWLLLITTVFASVQLRVQHPEYTETQLMLHFGWRWWVYVSLIISAGALGFFSRKAK